MLYALVIPAIRLALTQWRVRRAPPYRRVFTAAAIGLAYGSASLVFHAMLPAGGDRAATCGAIPPCGWWRPGPAPSRSGRSTRAWC